MVARYGRPSATRDRLFKPTYHHKIGSACDRCDPTFLVPRTIRLDDDPRIHYGTIGSANLVLKDSSVRDLLRHDLDVMCVEMEAAGVLDILPCLVIRGICDYADSHKSKEWQPYAAAVAAAYMKELLCLIPLRDMKIPVSTTRSAEIMHREQRQVSTPSAQSYACGCASEPGQITINCNGNQGLASCLYNLHPADSRPLKSRRILTALEHEDQPLSDKDKIQAYLDLLQFDQMDSRHATVQTALATTCEWMLERPEVTAWLDKNRMHEHYGFLWIKGKPAAGKSTMMKFIMGRAKSDQFSDLILSFFFNARGASLERSTEGMYRSLLFQLLEVRPDLQLAFAPLDRQHSSNPWSIQILQDVFSQSIRRLGRQSLTCFIDALDECDEDEIREMVGYLEETAHDAALSGVRLLICFSSRHYPTIAVERGLEIVLEDQEGHAKDITAYLSSKLKGGRRKQMESIKHEVLQRASGVFLWVVLVVKMLNKEYDAGQIHKLRKRLDDIPNGLQELFQDILTRGGRDMEDLTLCLQWILHAKYPLKCEELYYAILSETDSNATIYQDDLSRVHQDDMYRFLQDASRGLAEKTKGRKPVIQFIHESVREYLLKGDYIRALSPNFHNKLTNQCHDRLKKCCQSYLHVNREYLDSAIRSSGESTRDKAKLLRNDLLEKLPFIKYATQNLLNHADLAANQGSDQSSFLEALEFKHWLDLFNLVEQFATRRHLSRKSLLQILVETNLIHLTKTAVTMGQYTMNLEEVHKIIGDVVDRSDGSMAQALLTPVTRQADALTALDPRRSESEFQAAVHDLLDCGREREVADGNLLIRAARYGTLNSVKMLLCTAFYDVNEPELRTGRTALSYAAEQGREDIVRLLLSQTAYQLEDYTGTTPIMYAAERGLLRTVQCFVSAGAENALLMRELEGDHLFDCAVKSGNVSLVQYILELFQLDPDHRDASGRTLVLMASVAGHTPVVEYLIERGGINLNAQDPIDEVTPLIAAARNGNQRLVELLLKDEGIDQTLRDRTGFTACMRASENGHHEILRLLSLEMPGLVNVNNEGQTALWLAAAGAHERTFSLLLEAHRKSHLVDWYQILSKTDSNGVTPLMAAVKSRSKTMVGMLLDTGHADVNAVSAFGDTALSHAIKIGSADIVELLLSVGHASTHIDRFQGSALLNLVLKQMVFLHHCSRSGTGKILQLYQEELMSLEFQNKRRLMIARADLIEKKYLLIWNVNTRCYCDQHSTLKDVLRYLLQHHAVDVNRPDQDGFHPLLIAVFCGEAVIELLLTLGKADPSVRDENGLTALHLAAQWCQEAVVERLLQSGRVDVNAHAVDGRSPFDMAFAVAASGFSLMSDSASRIIYMLRKHESKEK